MTRSWPADAAGVLLLVLVAVSLGTAALVDDAGNPRPGLALLGVTAGGYLAGRLLTHALPIVAGCVVGAVIAFVIVSFVTSSFRSLSAATAPPLGYANADAALYVQTAALAALAAVSAREKRRRTLAVIAAVGFVVLAVLSQSLAGAVTGIVVLAALAASLRGWRPRRWTVLAGVLAVVLAAHLTVLALGAAFHPARPRSTAAESAAASSLSNRRLELWHDAVTIAREHPGTGVGPREFPVTSPTARADPDTREAHSATLQMAAETGWFGGVVLLCLFLWAAARPLLDGARAENGALVAAVAAAALAVHSAIDYVLDFPAVVVMAAFVLGASTGLSGRVPGARPSRPDTPRQPSG